ncbi:MAG: alpha/beta hydrolase fold protein [Alphaproteobacteria bacterium]|nr:alpha/beta hydrolase fold protein [Alphaproteobacteria bacterium]
MAAEVLSVEIRDVTIRLHRAGAGQKLLFLHGAGGFAEWLPFFDALAERYELLVPEHPGFGASDDAGWIRHVPDMAMFYLELAEALDIDHAHLVGHSLGGWIAAEVLIRDRARFQSLTLLAPAGIRVEGVLSGDTFIWGPEERVRNLFHDQHYAEQLLAIEVTEEQQTLQLKNLFAATKLGWQPRWYDPDLERWLHRIKLPSLIVWGADDKVMPREYGALWRERLPDARLVEIEECGHLPHVEKAEAVTSKVLEFLEGVAR